MPPTTRQIPLFAAEPPQEPLPYGRWGEALRRLQERGMLTVGAGRSLVVAELSKQQVLELYAMRDILEGSAARFAAQHANEA